MGNMMDLVVDLISNLVDHRGSSNSNGSSMNNWGSMGNSKRGTMGNSNRGSMGNSKRGSMGNSKRGSMGNRKRGSMGNSRSRCIDASKKTMPKKTASNDLSISISSGGSKATGNKGRQNN